MGKFNATSVEMHNIVMLVIVIQSILFICCIGFGANYTLNGSSSCIKNERDALINFNAGLLNSSNQLVSWVGDDCCTWKGIICDSITGHVIELDLSSSSLKGKVSSYLGNLSNLQYLDLSWNHKLAIHSLHFVSSLSSLKYLNLNGLLIVDHNWVHSINMLPSLLELHLSDCWLTNITDHISHVNLTSLELLQLSANNFNSKIPSWFYNLTNIQELHLSGSAFRGSLSTAIGNLNSLSFLDLYNNSVEGKLPETLSKLCNLSVLLLYSNNFSGEISGPFGNSSSCIQTSLRSLMLSRNKLNGSLPNNIGQFKFLITLGLSSNSFSGQIPVSIGQLYYLYRLDISYNLLNGIVSEHHLSNLTRLAYLLMSGNSLVFDVGPKWVPPFQLSQISLSDCKLGPQFPQWLKQQNTFLKRLEMSNASISDTIPDWFGNISYNINHLDLSYNQISGTMPTFTELLNPSGAYYRVIFLKSNNFEGSLTHFPSDVTVLDISDNLLGGQIPQTIGKMMPHLELLFISNNHLNGSIPVSLCRMEKLILLDLSKNQLSGTLPQCWRKSQALKVIDLSNNTLSGHIPNSVCSIEKLESLHLQNNRLQGQIPISLKNLTSLKTLDLSRNALAGSITQSIGESLSSLTLLNLQSNKLEGEIPLQLCSLTSLHILNLANNIMIGTIPTCFGNFTAMVLHKKVSEPLTYAVYVTDSEGGDYEENALVFVKGIELEYTRTLQFLCSIDLSRNYFVGHIPKELMKLLSLQNLNLSGNKLDGRIPWNIGDLKSLESLDLSMNNLSSSIPPTISDLNFLSHLNLSFNHLSGRIPLGNQIQTLDDKSIYMGNNDLCGPPLRNCKEDEDKPQRGGEQAENTRKDDSNEMVWFYSGMGMGFVAGFVGVCCSLYFKDSWRYACFGLVDRIYDKIWVTVAIKANQLKRKFHRN